MITYTLLQKYPIISDQIKRPALEVVLGELEAVLQAGTTGDVVEFGCYIGTTSLFLRRLLDESNQSSVRQLHVYDSFAGLPPKGPQDNSPVGDDFQGGELAVSKKQLLEQFKKARLSPPTVHKGWFSQLTHEQLPETIAFAFLDGDFYSSITDSLQLVWPRLSPGASIVVDDYQREALPGPTRAVQDFLRGKQYASLHFSHNIGVIRTGSQA